MVKPSMKAHVCLAIVAVALSAACGGRRPPVVAPAPPPPAAPPRLDVTRILAFGDSLTEGAATPLDPPVPFVPFEPSTPGPIASYPYKLLAMLKARYPLQPIEVFNGGRGGETVSDGRARLIRLLDELHPQVVILMEGVNDLNSGAEVEATAEKMRELVADARARGAVVLLSTLPRQREGGQRAGSVDRIQPFDEALAQAALQTGADLVDIYPEVTVALLAPDGLHLTEAGNQLLAEIYLAALRSKFEAASHLLRLITGLPQPAAEEAPQEIGIGDAGRYAERGD